MSWFIILIFVAVCSFSLYMGTKIGFQNGWNYGAASTVARYSVLTTKVLDKLSAQAREEFEKASVAVAKENGLAVISGRLIK